MPQNDKDFGRYKGFVTVFKQYITEHLPEQDRKGWNHGIYLPHGYDYKRWTKDDLTNLATTFNGFEMFEILVMLKDVAGNSPTEKLTAYDIECAQRALKELKPNNMSWEDFGNLIIDIEQANEEKREAIRQRKQEAKNRGKSGALIDLNKFSDIAGDPMDALDQQKALELLDKNAVKMDGEHSLKSPDPKAIALDVVKNIKGTVRAA